MEVMYKVQMFVNTFKFFAIVNITYKHENNRMKKKVQ